jgi:hypothetical protein
LFGARVLDQLNIWIAEGIRGWIAEHEVDLDLLRFLPWIGHCELTCTLAVIDEHRVRGY